VFPRRLRVDLQKVGRLYDFRAAEVPRFQKMIVAGNEIFRLGGDSTFEDAFVGRVVRDGIYTLFRLTYWANREI
jgi:hypothetical protein